jgi:hypothetical protein
MCKLIINDLLTEGAFAVSQSGDGLPGIRSFPKIIKFTQPFTDSRIYLNNKQRLPRIIPSKKVSS